MHPRSAHGLAKVTQKDVTFRRRPVMKSAYSSARKASQQQVALGCIVIVSLHRMSLVRCPGPGSMRQDAGRYKSSRSIGRLWITLTVATARLKLGDANFSLPERHGTKVVDLQQSQEPGILAGANSHVVHDTEIMQVNPNRAKKLNQD